MSNVRPLASGIGISCIGAAELYFGVRKSGSAKNPTALQHFLEPLEIADFGLAAAQAYGDLRHVLERGGTPIGPLDTQISAHALSLGVCLVSNNTHEFERVPGLKLANWVDWAPELCQTQPRIPRSFIQA